jgi:ATP-binding cassette, subfamily B, multidrug efflux pump
MGRVIEAIAEAPEERARNRGATLRRLLGEWSPYRRSLALALALVLVGAAAQGAGPWLISRAIDQDISSGDALGLSRTMLMLLAVYGLATLATRGQIYQIGSIGQRILAGLRARLFDHFQHLPLGYFDRRPIGDLMSRVVNDVDTLNQTISQGLTQLIGALFGLLGIVVAMLVLDVELALVSFTIIPVMLLTTAFLARRARQAFRATRETTGDVTAELQEEIVGVRESQAFNRTEANIASFRAANRANRNANVQAVGITSAFAPAMDVLSTLATAIVIGYGSYLVFSGALTVGLLAAFLIYVQQFFRPIQLASQVYAQIQSSLAGAERIYAILDEVREPADQPLGDDPSPVARPSGRIDFDHVSFAYEAGRPVLHDVSFTAEPGQTVALVGRTGAGKTTIANLISRFYDVTDGTVRLDGRDVRGLPRVTVRSQVAIVLQEPFLFSGTIAENIGYGRDGARREEIVAAARAVDAHDFIAALPDGYDTELGERGGSLSQGQRQLLSFARAVLADRPILILDEATSNVDTRTEALIQRALATLLAGRTSVAIAHRLSTIRSADLILVIDAGRIVERGTHASLLGEEGLYAELYRRQFRDTRRPGSPDGTVSGSTVGREVLSPGRRSVER